METACKTFSDLMKECKNYETFRSEEFLVVEWDCGPKCIATFKQRIGNDGRFADDTLYVGVTIENENVSHYFNQCVYDPLPSSVFSAVCLISVRMHAAELMGTAKRKVRNVWNDRDKLRDALREVVGWVNLNEAASGICPLPADMVARMRNVLKEVE